jgi:hypothetical protein
MGVGLSLVNILAPPHIQIFLEKLWSAIGTVLGTLMDNGGATGQ